MRKIRDCFIVFWISILAMILISSFDGPRPEPQPITEVGLYYPVPRYYQDTVQQDTIKKIVPVEKKKLSFKEERELETKEWNARQEQIKINMSKMDEQKILMDSLLMKIDTTKNKK